jgi:hypothetical protein
LCEFSAEFWELIAVQFFYFVCSNAWKWVLNFRCDKYGVYLPTFWYINRTQNKDFLLCPLCNKTLQFLRNSCCLLSQFLNRNGFFKQRPFAFGKQVFLHAIIAW